MISTLSSGGANLYNAPTGYAGQRHLVHAGGGWWFFYTSASHVMYQSAPETMASWSSANPALSFTFTSGTVAAPDGRSLGVETKPFSGSDAVHLSLASPDTTQPIQHARYTVSGGLLTLDTAGPASSTGVPPVAAITGPVTSINSAGLVNDFAGCAMNASCALSALTPDTGMHWTPAWALATPLAGSPSIVEVRATMALSNDVFVVWKESSQLLAGANLGSGWKPFGNLGGGSAGSAFDARTFATCVQQPLAGGWVGHLVNWVGPSFAHITVRDGGQQSMPAPPPNLDGVSELVLVCGPRRVHAFVIAAGSMDILGASYEPVANVWSDWAHVVTVQPSKQRCFLTGFDRVVPGDVVGLAWTEAQTCGSPDTLAVFSALVPVHEM
jgi:hypothetical protein